MGESNQNARILITGASGFIGRHLVLHLCPNHRIIAFARRTQKEVGLKAHPNINWILVDITDEEQFSKAFAKANEGTGIDFIFHLAAYYDFGDQVDSELYQKTNIQATRQLVEMAKNGNIKRFIFTSSLVASNFPVKGDLVYEQSELNATFPYAIGKQIGEKLVEEASEVYPCTIVRLAAVYSDWCEYEPLYNFFKIWLSDRWDARILPGKGSMAIPYVNVCCVIKIFEKILEKTSELDNFTIFLASSDKPVSLKELYSLATRHYYGEERPSISIPITIAKVGVLVRDLWGRMIGNRPFEKLWMTEYIDKQFPTDCSYTRNILDWQPKARHHISRRLLHLIENMKSRPDEWHRKNIDRLSRFKGSRPTLTLAEEMARLQEVLVEKIYTELMHQENEQRFEFYQKMEPEQLRWHINVVYNNLLTSVRHGDRSMMITFAKDLSHRRLEENVSLEALCGALAVTRDIITRGLYSDPKLANIKLLVHDYITLAIQLAMDEIKDAYEDIPR